MKEVFSVRPGSRILCDGEFATVRYVGELPNILGQLHLQRKGNDIWYGVEWDNVCRGKHNGTHHGVKYFETSQLDKLEEVVLREMRVNGAGQPGELQTLISSVTVLDLSRNLLSSWLEVARIAEQLLCLRELNVSENLIPVPEHPEDLQPSFCTLKTLVLNKMSYSWEQVLTCSKMWPQIERLELWKNEISLLSTPDSNTLLSLRYLSLEDNPLYSWQEVCKLGNLPRLEVLCLGNTTLSNIQFPGVKPNQKTDLFPVLQCLMITHNRLTQWKDVAELNKLINLRELRISHNPVMTEFTPETCRQLVIAKIDCLQRLNREEVTRQERRGAELDYLKRYWQSWIQNGGHSDLQKAKPTLDFVAEHPRFTKLIEIFGPLEESEVRQQHSCLRNSLITVEICTPNDPSFSPVIKKLPSTMTVGKVKALVKRIYNVGIHEMRLGCVSSQAANMEIELDNDLRQLSFYSVGNGDRLCVHW
ncbi:tubulin-specific chaperone E-like [Limulus polyphemus]|uniref:Tubulin-specific chaperone E n=1 Tax=Limulus polyphemus TaxID=6850 RepID=A0ABM1BN26_LIMPO|nr:tubulin-specific chaperone E-like [Limulus polyphemus]